MKGLIDGQCGQANPLVGLANNFTQNNGKINTGVDNQIRGVMPGLSIGEQLTDEYLRNVSNKTYAPSTFNMKALTQNLPQHGKSNSTNDLTARKWINDYSKKQRNLIAGPSNISNQWTQQYIQQQPSYQSSTSSLSTTHNELENIWQQSQQKTSVLFYFNFDDLCTSSLMYCLHIDYDFRQAQMWPTEYLDNFDSNIQTGQTLGNQWINEYESQQQNIPHRSSMDDTMLQHYEEEYDSLFNPYSEPIQDNPNVDYIFQSENPFINDDQLDVKGADMLKNGNIAEAVQYYEAAVQQNPQDSNAWCQLGLALAENENDAKAISAFKKSLEINPKNQEALVSISVSLANESMENQALLHLEKWIQIYTNNATIEPINQETSTMYHPYSMLDMNKFKEVETMFLNAARKQSTTNVDSVLQNALGILYNISRNFDRAIDSLNTALAAKPDDARLWNRLGATLANSDRTAEAISAYRQALTLFPTFVRARYNLGISCMHLHSYRDAVEHFLSALKIQKSPQNSPIWSTMRSAVYRMNPQGNEDLFMTLDKRDVEAFSNELSKIQR